ncbi:MAG: exodeoxyribonuclease III [Polyangiaceae bacterium]
MVGSAAMRLVTWNVNSIVARLDFVLDYLATRTPDVVCVQELKVDDDAFPQLAFAQAGYVGLTHGQLQWNGVAVLVKKSFDPAPRILTRGLPGAENLGARLVTASVAGISITSVYIPNGKSVSHADFRSKLAFLDALVAYARTLDVKERVVIAGDFNLVPADIDSWAGAALTGTIFHTEAERSRLAALCDVGFVDLYRAKYPDTTAYSWWDYRAGSFHKKQGLRIDLLLGTPSVATLVTEARVERDFRKKREGRIPSDHAPVEIELADAPGSGA